PPPPRLSLRPMHTDEAVHADNFGRLLEHGGYTYDPNEYHGPTLNYFTLPPAWLTAAKTYPQITEVTLRIVPVLFGTLLVLLTLFLADGLGPAAVVAALLAALSPALVFYSRYYIQEMLLVCFTFGVIACGYRYVRTRALPWAIAAGVFAGLMHATKETCIIAFGAMGLALVVLWPRQFGGAVQAVLNRGREDSPHGARLHLALGIVAGLSVSALFYSSFLSNPKGVLDSYLTYATYLGRGAGENTVHVHPWHYYLQVLLFSRYFEGPVWTEGWIVLLAVIGAATAVRGDHKSRLDLRLVRFLVVYTIVTTVAYSAVRYKTPWCLLTFLHGMILLAGVGAVTLWTWAKRPAARAAVVTLLVIAAGHLAFQTYRANFVYYADSRNPYVYAHPTPEILSAVERVKEYADLAGPGYSGPVPIQVIVPGKDYWPLPWYLRSYPQVAWRTTVPGPDEIGPLILISDKLEEELKSVLYEKMPRERVRMYMSLLDEPYYIWFRPGVKLMGFIRIDLWNRKMYGAPSPNPSREEQHGATGLATGDAVRGQ
ncbi:MAG: TIGR03663 family protein, partial [Planctomycetes bacterium]|nr:TIGR03663 family protein [Planctomycetota bacterium]